jgi:CBS domain-containing protein
MDIRDVKTIDDVDELLVINAPKVRKGARVHEAIQVLIDNPISRSVYVVDESDNLLGTISYRSLIRVGSARFDARKDGIFPFFQYLRDLLMDDVTELMRKSYPITKKDTIKDALKLMEETKQSDLPLTDDEGHLIGELCGMKIMKLGINVIRKGDEAAIEKRRIQDGDGK